MSPPVALVVAPHCTEPESGWFSPGRSVKIGQVFCILRLCGYAPVLLNTCPVLNPEASPTDVQLSRRQAAIPRLFAFLVTPLGRLVLEKPSLIWVYNSRVPETLVLWRLRRLYPQALRVVELEDLPAARKANASWRGVLDWVATRWLVRGATLVTCVSVDAADVLRSHVACSAGRVRILPPLLHEGFLRAVEQRHSPFRRRFIRVLYAGGYTEEKGVEDLLWAFRFLPTSTHRLHLVGPVSMSIGMLAKSMGHVYVHGCVNEKRLQSIYQQVDVVVNPHRAILNGTHVFPFKTIEQMASGALPLLSTSLGTDQLGLPQACLFRTRQELLLALENAPSIWRTHHENLTNLSLKLRHSHGVASVAPQLASWLSTLQDV